MAGKRTDNLRDAIVSARRGMKRRVPVALRDRLREATRPKGQTVAEGWERLARLYDGEAGELGNAWGDPAGLGTDVPATDLPSHLDRTVFSPFLRSCDVLLEIGPGGGRFTEILLPKCRRLIAADTSATMLKRLRARFEDRATPEIDYVLLDGKGLGFLDASSVDAAFSFDVFVHLNPWDFYNYLAELRRVLRPGGRAIIHHGNTFSELGWKKFLEDLGPSVGGHRTPTSFGLMSPAVMAEFCQRAELTLVSCDTEAVPRDAISLLER